MFKYQLGELVFYLQDNRIHSAPVLSRKYIDNLHPNWDSTKEQCELFLRFGEDRIVYATVHGNYFESQLFPSSAELLADANNVGAKKQRALATFMSNPR